MPVPPLRRPRTLATAAGVAALTLAAVVALPGQAGAAQPAATRTAAATPTVALGCGNVADHGSARPLPATRSTSRAGVTCFGRAVVAAGKVGPLVKASPVGLKPADLRSAYGLTTLSQTAGGGRTVAIVDAYDDPKAESDLAVYRSTYGLPACTTTNGCLQKVNQAGAASPLPAGDYGWAEEISLDLDAVSAVCPNCHILLVEATSPTTDDLMVGVDTAVRLGATAVSNSYGAAEDATILAADSHLDHPGVAITASSGDSGYGVSWPASSQYVTAVGGTTLTRAINARGWTEKAWSGAGSGCSAYEPKPAWQADAGCARRTVADVSADADPTSGLGVYDTYNSCGATSLCDLLIGLGLVQGLDGWTQVGGTSLSSPLVASVYALAGNAASTTYGSYPYGHAGALFDVTSGSNGSCGGTYLCTAGPGYDGPTGLGTPNGVGGF